MTSTLTALLNLPLFWATLTIAAFYVGQQLYRLSNNHVLIPPILTGLLLVVMAIELSQTPFSVYMQGGDYLHQWLGPVVVMLAIPLYQHITTMRQQWLRIILAVTLGSATTVACAMALAYWWIGDDIITRTMATKSITTPVAIAISEQVGGISALASAFVIATGIIGAILIPIVLKVSGVTHAPTIGLTLGVCAHAVGTGRALELGQEQAAYAAMAMTLTATFHAMVLPWLL
ncbi:MAG: LrgB family protein [Bacterioplanes sp.]|nr:LrgB family protein [Bacterioplanes sp.]